MIQLITADRYGAFLADLAEMHRLRYRIFKERLGWDVEVSGDMEIDEFDACRPVYLLQKDDDGWVQGCVRLLPTSGPTMLRDTFPVLSDGKPAPVSDTIWESSRFGVALCSEKAGRGIARATFELFAGMIEFGLMRELTDIVTVTDADSLPRELAIAPYRLTTGDRQDLGCRGLFGRVARTARVGPRGRRIVRPGDQDNGRRAPPSKRSNPRGSVSGRSVAGAEIAGLSRHDREFPVTGID